jgi:uncharacterized membrane protein
MSGFYILAGANHFLSPNFYMDIMPPYLPYHLKLIYISGVCEIVISVLLIPKATRHVAAWLLIALLIAVFPANIQMTINYVKESNPGLWLSIVRLPIQIILIWWAWIYTRHIPHPLR